MLLCTRLLDIKHYRRCHATAARSIRANISGAEQEAGCPDGQLQERHGLQVLFDYRVHDHLEDNLDVGGVGCCGEVVVDEFVRGGVE